MFVFLIVQNIECSDTTDCNSVLLVFGGEMYFYCLILQQNHSLVLGFCGNFKKNFLLTSHQTHWCLFVLKIDELKKNMTCHYGYYIIIFFLQLVWKQTA